MLMMSDSFSPLFALKLNFLRMYVCIKVVFIRSGLVSRQFSCTWRHVFVYIY